MKNKAPKYSLLAAAMSSIALLLGCQPDYSSVRLLDYDLASDSYIFRDVKIETLDDIWSLSGDATTVYGGAHVKLDYIEQTLIWKERGQPVQFSAIKNHGVLIPEDYDSLAMVSIYYNIEAGMLHFEKAGLSSDLIDEVPTYYWPKFEVTDFDGKTTAWVDNAIYLSLSEKERAFFMMPFSQFQWIPMPLNRGIVIHEYTHAVFDRLVTAGGDKMLGLDDQSVNFLFGLNEGVADAMAVASTGDPDFISHSVPKGVFVTQCNDTSENVELVRDASAPRDYTDKMDSAARSLPTGQFCPYGIGAFVSALLYEIAMAVDNAKNMPTENARTIVSQWTVQALTDVGTELQADFELWDFLSQFARRSQGKGSHEDICDIMQNRYSMYFDEVDGCR